MKRGLGSLCVLLLAASALRAEQYWIAYEGNDFPENEGWTRYWGNWQGEYQGPGAYRTLHDGIITYDSLYDPWVYDFNFIERPGQTDPGPGELFVMEWRLRVDEVSGADPWWSADPGVGVFSDTARIASFEYTAERIYSTFDPNLSLRYTLGIFQSYRMESSDMHTYAFYIDGALVHNGQFWQGVSRSRVSWGEGGQPVASLHHWDYLRFGVIPEPAGWVLFLGVLGSRCLLRR